MILACDLNFQSGSAGLMVLRGRASTEFSETMLFHARSRDQNTIRHDRRMVEMEGNQLRHVRPSAQIPGIGYQGTFDQEIEQ
jgi:hypothetical protein